VARDNERWRSITRRDALKALGAVGAAGLTGLSLERSAGAQRSRPPNIIFILSDDHRWDYLSCVGHPFVQTPVMDRLASEGVLFENAFVVTSLCSPSRATFLTGQYASTHGVKNNLTVWRDQNVTVLELLKRAGYDTAFIGKWHMPGRLPNLRGVDRFVTFTVQGGQGRYFDCPLIVEGEERPSRVPYITTELTNYGLEFLEQPRDRPFCLYLAHKAVHHEFLPPRDLEGLYADEKIAWPEETDQFIGSVRGKLFTGLLGPIEPRLRDYSAALVGLDREIGRIVEKLEEMGILDDTVFIYTSDNGYFWGEHRLVDKRWFYEESIRIPMIVRYPRRIADPGRRAAQMVLNVDIAPTLLDLAGLSVPAFMEGQSFAPTLASPLAPGRTAWLYEYFKEFPYNVPQHFAVRTRTHVYAEYDTGRAPDLYDVVRDPRQKHNLMGTSEGDALQPELKRLLAALKVHKRVRPS
jgi:N-acetylglucosamine-6-sulfatase